MKTAMCTCVLSLLVAVMVTAAPNLLVAYLEGSAYLQKGSSWEAISIGDAIPVTSNVRLDAGGSLKLSGIGTDIFPYPAGHLPYARFAFSASGDGLFWR